MKDKKMGYARFMVYLKCKQSKEQFECIGYSLPIVYKLQFLGTAARHIFYTYSGKYQIMLWRGRQGSGNVEDRRGIGGPVAIGGGIIGVIALLFNLLTGGNVDPSQLPIPGGGGTSSRQLSPQEKARQDTLAQFSKVVLRETELVWQDVLPQQAGRNYQDPTLVLFSDAVQSACGNASSATGPPMPRRSSTFPLPCLPLQSII